MHYTIHLRSYGTLSNKIMKTCSTHYTENNEELGRRWNSLETLLFSKDFSTKILDTQRWS